MWGCSNKLRLNNLTSLQLIDIELLEQPRWHTDSVTGMLQVFFTGMVFAGDVRKKVSCNSHALHSMHYIAVAGLIFILK